MADHLPVIQVSNYGKFKTDSVSKVTYFALREFSASLENADLSNIENQDNLDNCFKNLYDLLIDKFEKLISLKNLVKQQNILNGTIMN